MRTRKRDWPQRGYSYRAWPEALPQVLWDTARQQQALWNDLCVLSALAAGEAEQRTRDSGVDLDAIRRENRIRLTSASAEDRDAVRYANRERLKAAKATSGRVAWGAFEEHARELVRRSGLGWEAGPDILDRFRTALRGIGRNGKGPPRQHRALMRIAIPHRYTGGGVPVAKLWSPHATRCRLTPAGGFSFQVADAEITGRLVYHRPLPAAAIVKRTVWCGKYYRAFGAWDWSLNITVEEPPSVGVTNGTTRNKSAGLDLGWRVMAEGHYLRIGVLVDSDGRTVELRLPLDGANRDTRRARIPSRWADVAEYQQQMDAAVNAVRDALLRALTDAGHAIPPGWARLGASGLRRLLMQPPPDFPDDCRHALETWSARHAFLWRRREGLRLRLQRQREHRYRNIAAWLCARYGQIALERDMNLAQMAQTATDDPALTAAQHYRAWAATSVLRRYIQEAAAKAGTVLHGNTAGTSRRCATCGEAVEPGPVLLQQCEHGHSFDQDANSARLLLSQIKGVDARPDSLRKTRRWEGWESLAIPAVLLAVAVPCSLE